MISESLEGYMYAVSSRNLAHKRIAAFALPVTAILWLAVPLWGQDTIPPPPDEFITLGTEAGIGGKDFMRFDRNQIKHQIQHFIPPLLQPALVGHSFVLPPNTWRVSVSTRFATVDGNDFFRGDNPNLAVFDNFSVHRTFLDLDFFYGFDLNKKYLHSFTLRINIPYVESRTDGFIHPNGVPFIDLLNQGSTRELGDIGVFLKKKVVDQGNFPVGLAIAGAVFLPTGKNDEKFGDGGYTLARRPDPDNDGVQMSFEQMIQQLGGPQNFFNGAWKVPAAMLENAPSILTPFPFNGGVFGRFSGDGRLPVTLQPGTGTFSYLVGGFLTRQFEPGDFASLGRFPGRSALHIGILHRINNESDGIDPGDLTTFFSSFVKPMYKDFLALDLTLVGFHQQADHYPGKIPEPEILVDQASGQRFFEFALVDRPSFSKGTSMFVTPSLIYSPDPQLRFTATGLIRIASPELGPAPDLVFRFGSAVTF
ncbi:MAG: hypothetical protein ACE5HT_04220 [Gemmatimonadales bacterium]